MASAMMEPNIGTRPTARTLNARIVVEIVGAITNAAFERESLIPKSVPRSASGAAREICALKLGRISAPESAQITTTPRSVKVLVMYGMHAYAAIAQAK